MAQFHGVIVYEIIENGMMLNGIYTNTHNHPASVVDNEILVKFSKKQGVAGVYKCRYIETLPNADEVMHHKVTVTRKGVLYFFAWQDKNGKKIWEGIGLPAGDRHIAVSYVYA